MNAPFKTDGPPEWRLDDLYANREDPRIEADLARSEQLNRELAALEGQLVAARANPAQLGALIDKGVQLYEDATNAMWGVGAFGSLSASTQRDNPAWSRFESDLRTRTSQIAAMSLFFTLEINQLEDGELEAAMQAHPAAQRWRPWLRRVRAGRPHELSAELERLLIDKAPAVANWARLTDDTLAGLSARIDGETLTLAETLNRMSDPDPRRRKAAAQVLSKALNERTSTLALSLNTLAFEKQVEDRWRKFATPAAGRHLANEVDADAVAALEAAVVDGYASVSHRYYRLKARVMGRKVLDHWDRNCPLDEAAPRVFSWDQARSIVLESFTALAPSFAKTAETFFNKPWIDARPRPGKQSGAYSHPVTANRHPYVFMNYMGERRDVLTLAHELGHAVHQTMCQPMGTLLADTPLTLAETASIFGEGLVFEKLLAEASPAERRGLLAGKIEDGINTVVRQIAFHRFETRFHDARLKGELSADAIGDLWMEIMAESLGPAIRLGKGYAPYWAYITHFVHAPFYVYAYAFGDLLVRGLMEKRREDPAAFVPAYEKLLAAGGAVTYVEALAAFGLNPREKAFWAAGMKQLERLVDEFEALV
ncbi:M3 family oligoendopeptidase [Phenylobacterium sp.]|jgi:oligoendopeptidase F|uniref:M3 family oligoendopeptidase n=1 Tax=Phenylobacterium sp. TaxID=1871053 RepID=UPI0037C5B192